MKQSKLLFLFILLNCGNAFAQPVQTVQRLVAAHDYELARYHADSLLQLNIHRQVPALWFYKALACAESVRRQDSLRTELLLESLSSYKKYQELDPSNTLMKPDNNVGLFHLYDLGFNRGLDFYERQEYSLAYGYFKAALETENYIVKKQFSFNGKQLPATDTQLISLTAFSAYLSGREEEAIFYFERLAGWKMSGMEYKAVYTLLYQYFNGRQDAVRAARYLNTGRQVFRDEDYWIKLELGNPREQKEKLSRYEMMVQKYPSSFTLGLNYATELFNYVYDRQKPADYAVRQEKLGQLLVRLVKQDSNHARVHYILSQHVLNQLYDIEDTISEIEDESVVAQQKKKNLQVKLGQKYEELLKVSLKAYSIFSSQGIDASNREQCRQVLNQVINSYQFKKDGERREFYKARLAEL